MLHFSLESYKTVLNPFSILKSSPYARNSIHPAFSNFFSRPSPLLEPYPEKQADRIAAPRDRLETPCKCDLTLPRLKQECTRGRMKSGRGETFPCKWNAKSSTVCVCACVCICRSSWELRRSVSTTTKVPTKGFPISFNGALIATPTEGMEQPDEKGWREGPVTGAGGRKEKEGGGFDAITPARSGFQLTTGRPIVCEVSTEYRLSILLHRAGGALPRANFSRAL